MAKKGRVTSKATREVISRPIRWRKYNQLFLILCEDQNTERVYFERISSLFPEETMFVRTIGTGLDPLGVVQRAITEKNNLREESGKEIDFIWVVFDTDDADLNQARIDRFDEAFRTSAENGFRVAWSNEVFELWLLLHIINVAPNPAMDRQEVYNLLQERIRQHPNYAGFIYAHGNASVLDVINAIGSEADAMANAVVLENAHRQMQRLPINANPCTMVHHLVGQLREWIEWYDN